MGSGERDQHGGRVASAEGAGGGHAELIIDPAPERWLAMAESRGAVSEDARRFRQQLGVCGGGVGGGARVVLSGHQATLWHPGILAKYLATRAWAEAHAGAGWSGAWLVVDHDPEDCTALRVPVRDDAGQGGAASAGVLRAGVARVGPRNVGAALELNCPACRLPAFAASGAQVAIPKNVALAEIEARVQGAAGALEAARGEARTAGEQVARATGTLIAQRVGGSVLTTTLVSKIAATDAFAALVKRLGEESAVARATYNEALEAAPESARVAPLALDLVRGAELPLWSLDLATGARKRVFAGDLARLHAEHLLPRALLLTLLVRWLGCDLFVHGLGGGASEDGAESPTRAGYDRSAEAWARAWLGVSLAPSVVVSASVRLALAAGEGRDVSEAEAARAAWEAHAARHDPMRLGEEGAARAKRERVAAIAGMARGSGERRAAYRAMHGELERVVGARAGDLEALRRRAVDARAAARSAEVMRDRTWSFVLHSDEALRALDRAIRGRMGLKNEG